MMGITDILTFPVFGRSGFGVFGHSGFGVFGRSGFGVHLRTFGVRTFGAPFRTFGVFGPPKMNPEPRTSEPRTSENPERPKSYFWTFGVRPRMSKPRMSENPERPNSDIRGSTPNVRNPQPRTSKSRMSKPRMSVSHCKQTVCGGVFVQCLDHTKPHCTRGFDLKCCVLVFLA